MSYNHHRSDLGYVKMNGVDPLGLVRIASIERVALLLGDLNRSAGFTECSIYIKC